MDKQLTGMYLSLGLMGLILVSVMLLAAYTTFGGHEWVPEWLARPVD